MLVAAILIVLLEKYRLEQQIEQQKGKGRERQ